ncbi:DUF2806 domain-containing protein [Devosia sp.]|uniref:DUF2806 domain-containing protein n=1 Tax=Devosia sp. TaxID=1871048 RepID=UPI002FCA169D
MADKDDNELSIGVELTSSGVKLNAKSRFLSAFDRWGGSFFGRSIAQNERDAARIEAESVGEQQIIAAAARKVIEQMDVDPGTAQGLIEHHFGKAAQKQENLQGVLREAAEDLRNEPPTDAQNSSGQETVAPEVLDRMESYARDASTETLRHKWGRVLAAEIRKPGTVSNKVMRIVDELSPETAALFERINGARIGLNIMEALAGELTFSESSQLVGAGLLTDSSLGLSRQMREISLPDGSKRMFATAGAFAIAIPLSESEIVSRKSAALGSALTGRSKATLSVEVLTNEGFALASILKDRQEEAFGALLSKLRESIPEAEGWRHRGEDTWVQDKSL